MALCRQPIVAILSLSEVCPAIAVVDVFAPEWLRNATAHELILFCERKWRE
jgi:hypothetical protein